MDLWTFKGFVDEGGSNIIDNWYKDELATKAQIKLDWIIELFKSRPHNQWIAKYFKKLRGYDNLYEIRFKDGKDNIVYRPLGSFTPFKGDFTFTIGTTKKRKDILIPKDAEIIALKRLDIILNNPERAKECEFKR